MKILAIDLGGTSAKVGLVHNEEIVKRWQVPTKVGDIWNNIKDNLEGLKDEDYEVVGISMPGFIDHLRGFVKLAGNLNMKDYDAKAETEKVFAGKKVFIVNDANAAALGEYWKGAASNDSSTIFYTIGTGVGGGIVVNGHLVYGKDGYAGELGHGGNFQSKYPCTCGLKNCVEPLSSATGIQKLLDEKANGIKLPEAGKLLTAGDVKIKAIFKEALEPLTHHMKIMETALNPDSIVIGGGPSAIGEPLRKLIEDMVAENHLDFIAKSTSIKIATTKNDAGMWGAAFWALTRVKEDK